MGTIEGKAALVTGAASGIGAASARELMARGARCVIIDVAEEAGHKVAADIGAVFVAADVGDPDAWDRVVATVRHELGGLDLAHLNAGVANIGAVDVTTLPLEKYRRMMRVNLDGVFFGLRALVPLMAERGGGHIVVTASIAGLAPFSVDPVYTATKHAVVGLVRALTGPLSAQGITINAICPGGVDTPLLRDAIGGSDAALPAEAMIQPPSEVGAAAVELLESDETGRLDVVLAGRGRVPYTFAPIPTSDPTVFHTQLG